VRTLSRRDFCRLVPTLLGGAMLGWNKPELLAAGRTKLAPSGPSARAPGTFAETLFANGRVVTMDAADSIVQAVAIQDGVILKTGSNESLRALTGPNTRVVDLRGRTLTPGLIDGHTHPQLMGVYGRLTAFSPPEVKSIQDLKHKLADVAQKKARGDWIWGIGQIQALSDGRMPNRKDLDAVSTQHPVWIMHQGGHFGFANSLALKISNISANTLNPTGGVIERES
jgi:predicted amidohydrolase YtcJ